MAYAEPKEQSLRARHLKEYRAWVRLNHRCHNENYLPDYSFYGARGISVQDNWRSTHEDGFANFLGHVGPAPGPEHTIDRIDNDGDYRTGNVRWTLRVGQANNRRGNRTLTHNGRTLTIAQWAAAMNVDRRKLHKRIQLGWQTEDVLSPFPFNEVAGKIAA